MSIKNLEGATLSSRFRLERQLGRGGYGSVFEAEQLSVGRKCAVKVLAPQAGEDSTTESRFSQEARTTSQLTHPNSIVIYDFGRDKQRDVLWLAMELLDGETLQSRLRRRGPMTVERCLHVVRQAAESLHEAHTIGLVHRDIKPGNIMLLDRGGDPDFVKVIDFGIAKIVRDTLMPAGNMTQTGRILGTPKYMAPEQIRDTKVDGRADIYALATVVYSVLTANVPFSEGTAMEIASRQLTERPPKIRDLAPELDVGHAFESVLLQALSKDPNRRFEDILSFVDALEDAALPSSTDTPKITEKTEAIDAAAVREQAQATPETDDPKTGQGEVPDAHAVTDDEVVPTTEQMAGGSTPTADMGRVEEREAGTVASVDQDTDKPGEDAVGERAEHAEPQERGDIDVTLDTVAVASPRERDDAQPEERRESSADATPRPTRSKLVPIVALVSVTVFIGALGAWFTLGGDESAAVTPEERSSEVGKKGGGQAPPDRVAADRAEPPGEDDPSAEVDGPPGEQGASAEDQAPDHAESAGAEAAVATSDAATDRAESAAATPEEAGADIEDSGEPDEGEGEERARARHRMTVRAIPWGDLYVDGRHVGSGSNIDVTVSEGRRAFVLEQNGEVRARRTVDVSAGSPKIIELVAD